MINQTLRRILGAVRLDAATYEEVEADRSATGPAFLVVLFASMAAGVGAGGIFTTGGILLHAVHGIVLWYVWAYITYFVGTRMLPTAETVADHGRRDVSLLGFVVNILRRRILHCARVRSPRSSRAASLPLRLRISGRPRIVPGLVTTNAGIPSPKPTSPAIFHLLRRSSRFCEFLFQAVLRFPT